MKLQPISGFVLVGPEAVDKFPNCKGRNFLGDTSMLAVLRAIVWPRMRSQDFIRFEPVEVSTRYPEKSEIAPVKKKLAAKSCDPAASDQLLYLSCNFEWTQKHGVYEERKAWAHRLADSLFSGYEHVSAVEDFCERHRYAASVVIDRKTRSAAFISAASPIVGYRIMTFAISRLLPWYFPEGSLPKDGYERKLLNLLASEDYAGFKKLADAIGKRILRSETPYDFSDLVYDVLCQKQFMTLAAGIITSRFRATPRR